METIDAPRRELVGPRVFARWSVLLVLVTLALVAASIVLAVTSAQADLSPQSVCNASCYR